MCWTKSGAVAVTLYKVFPSLTTSSILSTDSLVTLLSWVVTRRYNGATFAGFSESRLMSVSAPASSTLIKLVSLMFLISIFLRSNWIGWSFKVSVSSPLPLS